MGKQSKTQEEEEPEKSGSGACFAVILIGFIVGGAAVRGPHPVSGVEQASNPPMAQGAPVPAAFTVYNQCSAPWGGMKYGNSSMCANGCGPTAIAMAITALTGKAVTPAETGRFMETRKLYIGGASVWTFPEVVAPQYGLRAEQIPGTEQAIVDAIKKGGMVIMAGHGQLPFIPKPSGGHYVLVRALDPDGKIRVGNSAFPATNQQAFRLASIVDNIHQGSVYALYAK